MRRVKAEDITMKLVPEDNQSVDPNRLSVSGVPHKKVLSGLNELYPPQDFSERNAISRTDGYWSFIKNGEDVPQSLTYGEFDFLFFSELLDRAHHHYFIEKGQRNGWDGKVFVDIGSGTGRLVIGASALHPGFSKCKGVEVLRGIHNEALQKLEKCNKHKIVEDGGHFSEISQPATDIKEEDNIGELDSAVGESIDAEPFTSEMIEMQKVLQQMSAEEWQDMMGDIVLDNDSSTYTYVENTDTTNTKDAIIVNNDVKGEGVKYLEEAAKENGDEYLNARDVPCNIHPEYSIPSEADLITIYGVDDEDDAAIEHMFDSMEEFDNLPMEEWKLIYGDDAVKRKDFIIRADTDLQTEVGEDSTRQHKKATSGEYALHSPSDPNPISYGTNELPLAPIEFSCGSFEDPYEYIGDADVAFVFSTCLPENLISSLSQAFGRQCKPGTIIITTDYKLNLEGYVDPVEDDPNLPFGEFRFEILEEIDGDCWVVGGVSTAYIHRVVQSLWVDVMVENGDWKEKPKLSLEEEARNIIEAMEGNKLTNTTRFVRSVQNLLAFHYPQQLETNSKIDEVNCTNSTEYNE